MAGVDHLVQAGVADPDRLVAMGWSAGGTLVNKLVTMTDRFKAALGRGRHRQLDVALRADGQDVVSQPRGSAARRGRRTRASICFWDNSPLKDVANVKTPTLLFAGEGDPRVPMAQSIEMYRALKSNGVPTRLYVAPREGHQWGELRHLLFKANTELEWFEKYAMGRTARLGESAPQP